MKKQKSGRVRSGNPAKQRIKTLSAPAVTLRTALFGKPASRSFARVRPKVAVGGTATALLPQLTREDRRSLLMLLAPFLIVASSLAVQQVLRPSQPFVPEIAASRVPAPHPATMTIAPPVAAAAATPVMPPAMSSNPFAEHSAIPALRSTTALRRGEAEAPAPSLSPRQRAERFTALKPTVRPEPLASDMLRPRSPPVIAALPATEATDHVVAAPPFSPPVALPPLASLAPVQPVPAAAAPIAPPVPEPVPDVVPASVLPVVPPRASRAPAICEASPAIFGARPAAHLRRHTETPGQFGLALAAAAHEQLGDLVIYNARYARISYPMGDVASFYGVCTDVVVRAYRTLGIDLQELIFTTKSGRGDIHIDHRRVDVVRKFLEKHGETLPISEFAEDFKPGDIITYYRPQNRASTSHIAVVSDRAAPSGRLMIIHNRGWGPQLEDALFVDRITGHYRFAGLRRGKPPIDARLQHEDWELAPARFPVAQTPWIAGGISRRDPLPHPSAQKARLDRHATARALCLPQPSNSTAELRLIPLRPAAPAQAKPKTPPTRTAAAVIPNR